MRGARPCGKPTSRGLSPFGLMVSFGNASGPVAPFAPGILGPKGSIYVTRQTLFSHITTRERTQAMADDRYLEKTRSVLRKHNGLWVWDETYVISKKREI